MSFSCLFGGKVGWLVGNWTLISTRCANTLSGVSLTPHQPEAPTGGPPCLAPHHDLPPCACRGRLRVSRARLLVPGRSCDLKPLCVVGVSVLLPPPVRVYLNSIGVRGEEQPPGEQPTAPEEDQGGREGLKGRTEGARGRGNQHGCVAACDKGGVAVFFENSIDALSDVKWSPSPALFQATLWKGLHLRSSAPR